MINTLINSFELQVNHNDISQVIGVAYTFEESRIKRQHLESAVPGFDGIGLPFSYFYKGDPKNVNGHEENIYLRSDPASGKIATHWPEAELAMLLGKNHEIMGYCLANDLTAASLEVQDNNKLIDPTYQAKVWDRCGSYGPKFVSFDEHFDFDLVTIGLKIRRDEETIFNSQYSLALRNRNFACIPTAIIDKYNNYSTMVPKSKQIIIDKNGYLPEGTLIMLGTGLIVDSECYCAPGDIITIYCDSIGELTNTVLVAPSVD